MYKKAYIEITNNCNYNCAFCRKPMRKKAEMSAENFLSIAKQVKNFTDYVYLHVFGEPLLHSNFAKILDICNHLKLKVNITTNGSLIDRRANDIIAAKVRKVSFSLHSFEGNLLKNDETQNKSNSDKETQTIKTQLHEYLNKILEFCIAAQDSNIITQLRLWNGGGQNFLNAEIENYIAAALQINPQIFDNTDKKLKDKIYIGYHGIFNWAGDNLQKGIKNYSQNYCLGLRDQFAILCDGTVTPCCIDSDGTISLGNVNEQPLEQILSSTQANQVRDNFAIGKSSADLCLACDFRK